MRNVAALILFAVGPAGAAVPWTGISIQPKAPRQGDVLRVVFDGMPKPSSYRLRLDGEDYPIKRTAPGRARGLLPTTPNVAPGEKVLRVYRDGFLGKESWKIRFKLRSGNFPEKRLKISKEKEDLFRQAETEKAQRAKTLLRRALDTDSPRQFWRGPFLRPVPGRLTGRYGRRRVYNDKPSSRYHRGDDFAGRTGSAIRASNAGIVVYAAETALEGRSVVVDHGHGVVSLYIHMDRFETEAGRRVERGDLIGRVGMSGVATGPHLHFGIYVNGKPVDTIRFLKRLF